MTSDLFKNWFKNKLTIGSFPFTQNELFIPKKGEYVINLSDEFYSDIYLKLLNAGCRPFWFPMNEVKKDAGLNSIYGAMCVLWDAEMQDRSVYLHCHAGINRSEVVRAAFFFLKKGHHWCLTHNMLLNMCNHGCLPPKAEMEAFLTELGKQLLAGNMMGGILDHCKLETIK